LGITKLLLDPKEESLSGRMINEEGRRCTIRATMKKIKSIRVRYIT
jgi:hypothetical protein